MTGNQSLAESTRDFYNSYVSAPRSRRFVLGTGEYARSIANSLGICAFVDDFTSEAQIENIPVIRSADLPPKSLVIVASMLRPKTALSSLKNLDVVALDYFALAAYTKAPVKPVAFWPRFAIDYRENHSKYDALRARLDDAESRELLDSLIRFRLNGDLSAMENCDFNPQGQYFEDFLELNSVGETFIDIGSFDGQTSIEFAKRVKSFDKILAFEPSAANFSAVESALESLRGGPTEVLQMALGAKTSSQRFSSMMGSSSRATEDGESVVNVVTLDSLNLASGSFLKMDIEGAEIEALRGARETIRRLHPRLAVSVYHRFDDLWRVPEVVDEVGLEYRVFLRHYTEGIDETVMYFIPPYIAVGAN